MEKCLICRMVKTKSDTKCKFCNMGVKGSGKAFMNLTFCCDKCIGFFKASAKHLMHTDGSFF